jgi:hypothetical protein
VGSPYSATVCRMGIDNPIGKILQCDATPLHGTVEKIMQEIQLKVQDYLLLYHAYANWVRVEDSAFIHAVNTRLAKCGGVGLSPMLYICRFGKGARVGLLVEIDGSARSKRRVSPIAFGLMQVVWMESPYVHHTAQSRLLEFGWQTSLDDPACLGGPEYWAHRPRISQAVGERSEPHAGFRPSPQLQTV